MWNGLVLVSAVLAVAAAASFYQGLAPWTKNVTLSGLHESLMEQRKLFDKIPSLIDVATERFLQLIGDTSGAPSHEVCEDPGFLTEMDDNTKKILMTIVNYQGVMEGLEQMSSEGLSIGSTTALIAEANDAGAVDGTAIADGESGSTDFPHGNLKPIVTSGERSVCPGSYGEKFVGVPDGLGAYLADDKIVRLVVQSEGYGPIRHESYTYPVNGGKARIAGSHIQYVDYLREDFASFMSSGVPASSMVTGMGEMVMRMYNLKGEEVGTRNGTSATTVGAHYSNTDEEGIYVVKGVPAEGDWLLMSLCSAHLEEKHQWGPGIGFEDDIFITNEEWIHYAPKKNFVGISAHALDIQAKSLHAVGAFTNGGFEKIVELNPRSEEYVILGVSGYNGPFIDDELIEGEDFIPEVVLEARNAEYSPRPDGTNYTWTENIVPFRMYVGVKGKLEDGSDAPADDFLARNGLKYGQLYGFAIDMRNATGPTSGAWRDAFHKTAQNGDMVPGKWIAQPWKWNGQVRNFQHDGSWDYQLAPPGTGAGDELEGFYWWNAGGDSMKGCKTEHLSPDPREGLTAFVQGSTCGYFGHLYLNNVSETLGAANGDLPSVFDGTYYVYQGETDITGQVELNGAGKLTDGINGTARDQTHNWDKDGVNGTGKVTFEDIDGLEVFEDDGTLYVMIQEDSTSLLGDRMFISSPLEHEADGNNLTYYFVAMSGGKENTRAKAGVSVPAGVRCFDGEKYVVDAHEFSGLFDLSGLIRRDANGTFILAASDDGSAKRANDAAVPINEKNILVALQAGDYTCGVIGAFQGDRGGQLYIYQPEIPA